MKLLIPVVLILAVGADHIEQHAAASYSESVGLFGFKELGYREAIVISIVLDVATIVLLGIFVQQAAAAGEITSGTSASTSAPGTRLDRCRPGTRQGRAGRSARARY